MYLMVSYWTSCLSIHLLNASSSLDALNLQTLYSKSVSWDIGALDQ